jgi:hypothetical protein
MRRLIVSAMTMFMGFATVANAYVVTFHNRSSRDSLCIAVGKNEIVGDLAGDFYEWHSEGWYCPGPGQDSVIYVGDAKKFYYYAYETGGKYWYASESNFFCIKPGDTFSRVPMPGISGCSSPFVPKGFVEAPSNSLRIDLGNN